MEEGRPRARRATLSKVRLNTGGGTIHDTQGPYKIRRKFCNIHSIHTSKLKELYFVCFCPSFGNSTGKKKSANCTLSHTMIPKILQNDLSLGNKKIKHF